MIRFYLAEEPILNNVPTLLLYAPKTATTCSRTSTELVVKEVHGAGGYGMLIGPAATAAEREAFRAAHPRRARDATSRSPRSRCRRARRSSTAGLAPRHIDLRPYVLSGKAARSCPAD